MRKIILASKSPSRFGVLKQLGLEFKAIESPFAESWNNPDPLELVKEHAIGKARAVAPLYNNSIIIGADTIAVFEGELLGKPKDQEHAVKMLRKLSGKTHSMLTCICTIDTKTGQEVIDTAETKVVFENLSEQDIQGYVATGEPLGKAGAYAIQGRGAALVKSVEGDYYNIMGLPVSILSKNLKKLEVSALSPE